MEARTSPRVKRSVAFLPFWALAIVAAQQFQLGGIAFLAVAILGAVIPGYVLMRIWPDDRDAPRWPRGVISREIVTKRILPFLVITVFALITAFYEGLWAPMVAALVGGYLIVRWVRNGSHKSD